MLLMGMVESAMFAIIFQKKNEEKLGKMSGGDVENAKKKRAIDARDGQRQCDNRDRGRSDEGRKKGEKKREEAKRIESKIKIFFLNFNLLFFPSKAAINTQKTNTKECGARQNSGTVSEKEWSEPASQVRNSSTSDVGESG